MLDKLLNSPEVKKSMEHLLRHAGAHLVQKIDKIDLTKIRDGLTEPITCPFCHRPYPMSFLLSNQGVCPYCHNQGGKGGSSSAATRLLSY